MSLTRWLANYLNLSSQPKTRRKTPTSHPRFRPTLEALEDRWVPSTLTVTNNLDNGAGSLRYEISAAHKGDTINFAPSLDGQTITLTSGQLNISKNLTIKGPGAGELTISGNNASRIFEVAKGTQDTLSGLTISNGLLAANSSASAGAGIENYGTLTVSGCTLSNNSAYLGGAIYNHSSGTLTVSNSFLTGNSAQSDGGGINNDGTVTISGSTLSDNSTYLGANGYGAGGGIISGGTLTITNSNLDDNFSGQGGGIFDAGTLKISGTTFSYNSANQGGGLWIGTPDAVTIGNCTLSNNSASFGGGIYNHNSTLTLSACSLSGNSAAVDGGAVYNASYGTVTVENGSSITGNTAPAGDGADVYNLGVIYLDSTSTIGVLDGNPAKRI